jgi:hypothetical protein
VLPLYTEYGVVMPRYGRSVVKAAVEKADDARLPRAKIQREVHNRETGRYGSLSEPMFARIQLVQRFIIRRARTTAESNQELFIFKKGDDGKWRIARYTFSPTNPPAK